MDPYIDFLIVKLIYPSRLAAAVAYNPTPSMCFWHFGYRSIRAQQGAATYPHSRYRFAQNWDFTEDDKLCAASPFILPSGVRHRPTSSPVPEVGFRTRREKSYDVRPPICPAVMQYDSIAYYRRRTSRIRGMLMQISLTSGQAIHRE